MLDFVSETKLMQTSKDSDEKTEFIGRKNRGDENRGGYLNYGTLVCNGVHLIWLSRHNMHLFELETGMREVKDRVFSGSDHITCFDASSNLFYGQDAAVYSWLDQFEVYGFFSKNLKQD